VPYRPVAKVYAQARIALASRDEALRARIAALFERRAAQSQAASAIRMRRAGFWYGLKM